MVRKSVGDQAGDSTRRRGAGFVGCGAQVIDIEQFGQALTGAWIGRRELYRGIAKSQTYDQRRATVEQALAAEKINPGKGKTLSALAAKVLDALDHIKESVR
jgi:hypothetical protein